MRAAGRAPADRNRADRKPLSSTARLGRHVPPREEHYRAVSRGTHRFSSRLGRCGAVRDGATSRVRCRSGSTVPCTSGATEGRVTAHEHRAARGTLRSGVGSRSAGLVATARSWGTLGGRGGQFAGRGRHGSARRANRHGDRAAHPRSGRPRPRSGRTDRRSRSRRPDRHRHGHPQVLLQCVGRGRHRPALPRVARSLALAARLGRPTSTRRPSLAWLAAGRAVAQHPRPAGRAL